MFEAVLLVLLVGGVAWAIRSKPPLVLEQAGRFHATLAPSLAAARPFIERIAEQYADSERPVTELATLYFRVQEASRTYLMAIALRDGLLYFQLLPDGSLPALRDFSEQVMLHYPLLGLSDSTEECDLQARVAAVAQSLKISCSNVSI